MWRSSRKSAFSSLEYCSMTRLNSRTRSTTRAKRVDVEKINVPQAEIKTAGVNIALKTLKECEAFCMALNQSVNPLGELEILLSQPAFAVSHYVQTDLIPTVNQNVGMVIHGLGFVGDAVDELHRAFEVFEFQIARQPIAFPPPIRHAGKGVLDLLFVQLHLFFSCEKSLTGVTNGTYRTYKNYKSHSFSVRPTTKSSRMFAHGMRLAQCNACCID